MCNRSRSDGENEDFRHPPDLFLGSANPDGMEEAPFFVPFGPDSDLEFPWLKGSESLGALGNAQQWQWQRNMNES